VVGLPLFVNTLRLGFVADSSHPVTAADFLADDPAGH
jgi:hypothetical protein